MFESLLQQFMGLPISPNPFQWSIIDFMIFLTSVQYYMLAGLLGVVYFGFVKWFTNPLLTRNQHELILILSPGKAKVFKATERLLPFFSLKHATYWYANPLKVFVKPQQPRQRKSKPKKERKPFFIKKQKKIINIPCTMCENKKVRVGTFCNGCGTKAEAPKILETPAVTKVEAFEEPEAPKQQNIETGSMVHIYVDAVNQPIYDLKRNENKVLDLVTHREGRPEVRAHKVIIPPTYGFGTNWIVAIDEKNGAVYIERTRKRQPFKVNFFVRLGVYIMREAEVKSTTGGATTTLEAITVQKVVEAVGGVVKNSNFSASFSRKLIKDIKKYEYGWIMTLLGLFDMRILLIIIIMFGAIVMYFLFGRADINSLGPPPAGVAP